MTLTNDSFADSMQVAQNFTEEQDGGACSGGLGFRGLSSREAGSGGKRAQSAGENAAEMSESKAVGQLTPEQRQARLVELEHCIATAQDSPEALQSLYNEQASLLFAIQDYGKAAAVWQQSLVLQPEQAQIWYNRGVALDNQGSHLLALASYDRVIKLEPGHHIAWGNRAIALRKLGRHDEAKEAVRIAFELNPNDMVDSFFKQLTVKHPKLGFVWKPLRGVVQRLRR